MEAAKNAPATNSATHQNGRGAPDAQQTGTASGSRSAATQSVAAVAVQAQAVSPASIVLELLASL